MSCAGLEPADHLVGAALDPAFTSTFTVFGAETLATITSGAIQHGALLLLFSTTIPENLTVFGLGGWF